MKFVCAIGRKHVLLRLGWCLPRDLGLRSSRSSTSVASLRRWAIAKRKAAKQTARKNDENVRPRERLIFFYRGASFGDCTHMTAYFVVPTSADIIYTAEYRPVREILACRKIFFRATNARASGEKIPPPDLRPGILTPPADVSVVCCAYETGVHTDLG